MRIYKEVIPSLRCVAGEVHYFMRTIQIWQLGPSPWNGNTSGLRMAAFQTKWLGHWECSCSRSLAGISMLPLPAGTCVLC